MTEMQERRLAAIMFTDIVGYSTLMKSDEALAMELLRSHWEMLRPLFPKYSGKEIKTMGDGFLVEFASAVQAAQCAIEIQRVLQTYNKNVAGDRQIHLRIGLHVGDLILQESDVFGDAVNIASRIEPLAAPGGICVSEDIARHIQDRIDFPLEDLGRVKLKNISTPMRVCRIVLPWEGRPSGVLRALPAAVNLRRMAIAALVVLAVVFLLRTDWRALWPARPLVAPGQITSIAVLPFNNLTGDPAQEYFVDGITEALIVELAKVEALKVISRTSVMQYKGVEKSMQTIADELGVEAVVEGSVFRDKARVRITAQLIDAAADRHLWGEVYDRDLNDVMALQTLLARAIVQEIRVAVTPRDTVRMAQAHAANLDAYEAYLKGRYHWNKRTGEDVTKAIQHFEYAIEMDPTHALSYVGLADCYNVMDFYTSVPPSECFPKAKAMALRALELDPTLGEAFTSLAAVKFFYEWDWLGAEEDFKRAIKLAPGHPTAHQWYSELLKEVLGLPKEALAEMRRAQELDPLSLIISVSIGEIFYFERQYEQAIKHVRTTLALDEDFAESRKLLGECYLQTNRIEKAIMELEEAVSLAEGAPRFEASLGYAYAMANRSTDALKVLERLKELPYASPFWVASVHVGLQDEEEVFAWLERAYEEHKGELVYLRIDPRFDPLRTDPRFQDLLLRMNFPQ